MRWLHLIYYMNCIVPEEHLKVYQSCMVLDDEYRMTPAYASCVYMLME